MQRLLLLLVRVVGLIGSLEKLVQLQRLERCNNILGANGLLLALCAKLVGLGCKHLNDLLAALDENVARVGSHAEAIARLCGNLGHDGLRHKEVVVSHSAWTAVLAFVHISIPNMAEALLLKAATDLPGAARDAEQLELQGCATDASLSVQLAAYLASDRLDEARFLWKRAPAAVTEQSQVFGWLVAVGRAVWQEQPAQRLLERSWPDQFVPIIAIVGEHLRERTLRRLRAFSVLRITKAVQLLEMPASDAAAYLASQGWTIDEASSIATAPVPEETQRTFTADTAQIAQLTSVLVHLDQ
eukprot:m.299781 g.299781  ORF g.299781 m.299781 type:complete len:300 (-) comp14243_c0_seq1:148-1047(-)